MLRCCMIIPMDSTIISQVNNNWENMYYYSRQFFCSIWKHSIRNRKDEMFHVYSHNSQVSRYWDNMCYYSRQLCLSILNILEGTEKIICYMIIPTESEIMSWGGKYWEDMCDIQGNYSGVFEHFSMNRNDVSMIIWTKIHLFHMGTIMEKVCGNYSGMFWTLWLEKKGWEVVLLFQWKLLLFLLLTIMEGIYKIIQGNCFGLFF